MLSTRQAEYYKSHSKSELLRELFINNYINEEQFNTLIGNSFNIAKPLPKNVDTEFQTVQSYNQQ